MENNKKRNLIILIVVLVVLAAGCVTGGYFITLNLAKGNDQFTTAAEKKGSSDTEEKSKSASDKSDVNNSGSSSGDFDESSSGSSSDELKENSSDESSSDSASDDSETGKSTSKKLTATPRPTATPMVINDSSAKAGSGTDSSAGSTGSSASTAGDSIYYADVDEYLTLRNGASTSAGEIERLAPCASMKLIAKTNDTMWQVEVVSTGSIGYVNKDYIIPEGGTYTRINSGTTTSGEQGGTVIYYANVDEYLTLRNAASTSASELARLAPKTEMKVLEHTNDTMWYVEVISTGTKGYVNKNYILAK